MIPSIVCVVLCRHGQVGSVRVLYERRCAFVNYIRPESAAMALKKLQVRGVCGVCMYNVHEIPHMCLMCRAILLVGVP